MSDRCEEIRCNGTGQHEGLQLDDLPKGGTCIRRILPIRNMKLMICLCALACRSSR